MLISTIAITCEVMNHWTYNNNTENEITYIERRKCLTKQNNLKNNKENKRKHYRKRKTVK